MRGASTRSIRSSSFCREAAWRERVPARNFVDEPFQPGDLLALALERLGLVLQRLRALAAVGAVLHVVELAAAALELEHPGRDALEEPAIVRDEQHRAVEAVQLLLEPLERAEVEVVRRLVEQQQVRVRRERTRERGPGQLAARERLERTLELLVGEPEPAQDRPEARTPGVAAGGLELTLGRVVLRQRRGRPVARRHARLELGESRLGGADVRQALADVAAEREAARQGRALIVQRDAVALGVRDAAGIRLGLAREHAQERRLARAVPPDQGEPLARRQRERDAREDDVRPEAVGQTGRMQGGHPGSLPVRCPSRPPLVAPRSRLWRSRS